MSEGGQTAHAFWADSSEDGALQTYRALVDTIDDAIYRLDADGQFVAVNDVLVGLFGYAREELLGEHVSVVVDDAAVERVSRVIRECHTAPGDDVVTLDIRAQRADGEQLPIELRVNTLTDAGEVTGFVGVARERQPGPPETEEAPEFAELVDRISDGFFALDENWEFTHVNQSAHDIINRDGGELVGKNVWEEFPAATERQFRECYERAMTEQETVSFVEYYPAPLDSWFEVNAYPSETGLSVYFQDITEWKEREQELERALDLLERTEEVADVGGWEIDTETMDVYWSENIFDVLQVEDDEEPPLEEALDMYHDDDQPVVENAVDAALESGEPFDVEARIHATDGGIRWLRLQGVPEVEVGDVVSLRGAAQNITERKRREDRLEELVEELEESNERLEQFAYAASHDLQEPLRMVSSYLSLIERRYEDVLDEDGQEFLEYAVDGAERMRDMIDALLTYSRVETRGDPFEPVDLKETMASVLSDYQMKLEETDADVSTTELPTVYGDESQLRQVFGNLLSNALEYSGDGPPTVRVSAERDGDRWIVAVEDEGIGIDPKHQDRVFEVFQRLHTQEEYGGTGIGLALAQRIVERHDGEIWVESEPGEGSTFYCSLPVVQQTND